MSVPSYSGIPYPTSRRETDIMIPERRGSFTERRGSISERRSSFSSNITMPPPVVSMIPATVVPTTVMVDRIDRDMRNVEFHDNSSLPKRVNQMDMEFQRLKVQDSRKRSSAPNQEDQNGTFFSNYIAQRVSRVVDDYRKMKYDEAKNVVYPEMRRRSGSLSMGPRTGSFTQLNQLPQTSSGSPMIMDGPVEQVEWFTRDNSREHRTDRYDIVYNPRRNYPVYRRGQNFFFALRMSSRSYDLNRFPIFVYFNFGSNPSVGKFTRAALTVTGSEREFVQRDKSEWDIRVHHQEGNVLTLQVGIPANAPVGAWSCEIHHNNEVHRCKEDIYILFNPYCSEDPVYLDNEQFRREYVLCESGKVFRGTYKNQKSCKWIYGQFNDFILPVTCLLLDRFTEGNRNVIDYAQRGSAVHVSRALASMIYSKFGLLKETDSREDDFSTYCFTGTFSVFEKLLEQQFRPIETDQTYMASAIYVSFCRTLGLPCRSVTSYRAPIEKNSLNVDLYWSEENERESDLYEAYHCWNDVWIRRDDLMAPNSYLGWQAVDPNTQGYGPAPAEAVRKGEVGLNFDIFYFYSMLNSQFRHFYTNTFPERIVSDNIGRLVVTKRCDRDDDDDDFEDITHLYKKKDGNEDDKLVVMNSYRGTLPRRGSVSMRSRDAMMGGRHSKDDLVVDWSANAATFGQNLQVSLMLQNSSNENRTLVLSFFARPLYRGVVGRKMKHFRRQINLQPNQREGLSLELSPQDYQDRLDEDYLVRFYACVYVKETNQFWAGDEDVTLAKPKINIQTRSVAQLDTDFQVSFSMINPLSETLTDCYIFYEAVGLTKPVFRRLRDIKPGEMLNINETVIPRKPGDNRLVAVFNSRQLRRVVGSKMITVRE